MPNDFDMHKEQIEMIAVDAEVVHGQPRIRGTRIPVSVALDCLAAGMTEKQILAQSPILTVEGIRAAVANAAVLARE